MTRRIRWIGGRLAGLIALGLLARSPAMAWAHEQGVLKPASRALTAGDSLPLAGEKFSKNATLKLLLVGVGGRVGLGEVRTDTKGGFTTRLLVPSGVARGAYRLVALATDGDEVAGLDVTVNALAAGEHTGAGEHAQHERAAGPDEPSAEPLALERARSPLVTGGAVGGIVLALALAGVLLRPRRTA